MRIANIILSLIVLCAFTACIENNSHTLAYDVPKTAIITPDNHRLYEALPLELSKILESLSFADPELNRRVIGGAPEQKIKTYNVVAYVEYYDGWLIASEYSEWGGVVFWVGKDGGYEIIRDDDLAYPIDVIVEDNTVFITQGMLGFEGHLLDITRKNGMFETDAYLVKFYADKFEKYEGNWIIPSKTPHSYLVVSELRAGRHTLHKRN